MTATTPSRCVTRSMTASQEHHRKSNTTSTATNCVENSCTCCSSNRTTNTTSTTTVTKRGERTKRSRCNSTRKKVRSNKRRKCNTSSNNTNNRIELSDLSEEVLIAILEHVSAPGLVSVSKTSWLFHRICHTDTLWKHRCRVSDFFSCWYIFSNNFNAIIFGPLSCFQSVKYEWILTFNLNRVFI